ncbi:MAG: class A beta-lactamase-related serine hydrolase [Propionibacteriaceae bacterium]|nr:class A beta-lactamase-related serine hydrolase [Propionibacteriaceae bacterium]
MADLHRRSFLGIALALTLLVGCSTSVPVPKTSPTGSIRAQLDEAIKIIANGSDKLGVFILDLNSGETYSHNGEYASQNASMIKPMIVLMALRKAAADGGTPTNEQLELAAKAIRESDNDAASTLWEYAGGADAYQALAADLGMENTHRQDGKPDWSWTWTTPEDQVALVTALAEGNAALPDSDREFVFNLMAEVKEDQTWGVGTPRLNAETAKDALEVHLKNGWVQFKSSDGLWAVNSMGQLEGEGRHYRLAIMSRTPDFDTGRETASAIGQWVYNILGTGSLD